MNLLEMCAGAGGQALGIEQLRFEHKSFMELDAHAWYTLCLNQPNWNVRDRFWLVIRYA